MVFLNLTAIFFGITGQMDLREIPNSTRTAFGTSSHSLLIQLAISSIMVPVLLFICLPVLFLLLKHFYLNKFSRNIILLSGSWYALRCTLDLGYICKATPSSEIQSDTPNDHFATPNCLISSNIRETSSLETGFIQEPDVDCIAEGFVYFNGQCFRVSHVTSKKVRSLNVILVLIA